MKQNMFVMCNGPANNVAVHLCRGSLICVLGHVRVWLQHQTRGAVLHRVPASHLIVCLADSAMPRMQELEGNIRHAVENFSQWCSSVVGCVAEGELQKMNAAVFASRMDGQQLSELVDACRLGEL